MNLENIDFSNPTTIIILAIVALAIVLTIAAIVHKQTKTARLRKNFGAEYDRAVLELGSERKAQTENFGQIQSGENVRRRAERKRKTPAGEEIRKAFCQGHP